MIDAADTDLVGAVTTATIMLVVVDIPEPHKLKNVAPHVTMVLPQNQVVFWEYSGYLPVLRNVICMMS